MQNGLTEPKGVPESVQRYAEWFGWAVAKKNSIKKKNPRGVFLPVFLPADTALLFMLSHSFLWSAPFLHPL